MLNFRNENDFCDRCNEEANDCCCYVLIAWEGDNPMEEQEVESLEQLLTWGSELAFEDAPPRVEGQVLNVLPILFAQVLCKYFMQVAIMDREGYECAFDMLMDIGIQGEVTKREVYDVLVAESATDASSKRVSTDGLGTGGNWDNIEVEDPEGTRRRMEAIISPAIEAIEKLNN